MKRKAMTGIRLCLTVICLGITFVFWGTAAVYGSRADDFSHTVTVWSQDVGFDAGLIQKVEKDPERENVFAAWKEIPDSILTAAESNRTFRADVIMVYGSSYCLMPYGKIMDKEDTTGCLIGKCAAEELFGSHRVEGQELIFMDRTFTVRGIVEEPENLLLCEMPLTEEDVFFDRISFFTKNVKDGRKTAENFINRYGLGAELLRFDFYQDLSWFQELIPGKWSDFSGWKENIKMHKKQKEQVGYVRKSCLEEEYLLCLHKRDRCALLGIIGAATGSVIFVFGILRPAKPK